ncbi:MAG: MFS transporter, partial [Pseudomonadota bacterium]
MYQLIAVIGMIAAFGLTMGYTYPALSLVLEARGFSAAEIGLQTAAGGVGIIVGSLLSPWLAMRVGAWNVTMCAIAVTALLVVLFAFVEPLAWWYPMRIALGAATSILFVISETWVNQLAPSASRGQVIGAYNSTLAGMFAFGPMLVALIGFDGALPYILVAALLLVLGLPVVNLRRTVPVIERTSFAEMRQSLSEVPVLLYSVFVFGFLDAAALGLWAVYAIERGVDPGRGALLLTCFIAGNVLLQVPLGWLADRTDRRRIFVICALGATAGAALLPLFDLGGWAVVPFLMLFGALSFGVYTLAMTIVGEVYTGGRLVAINAGFSIMWGVGSLFGGGF